MKVLLSVFMVFALFSCSGEEKEKPAKEKKAEVKKAPNDLVFSREELAYLKKIKKRGSLRIAIVKEPGVYQENQDGKKSGFHYELAKYCANQVGVKATFIEVQFKDYFSKRGIVSERAKKDPSYSYTPDLFERVDFYASTITILPWRKKLMELIPNIPTTVNLVTRQGEEIHKLEELKNKRIAVLKNTSYEEIIKKIEKELKTKFSYIYTKTGPEGSRLVSEKKADVTLQDSNLVLLHMKKFKNINISMSVSPVQFLGWGVRKKNKELASILKKLLTKAQRSGKMNEFFIKEYNISLNEYLKIIGVQGARK